MRPWSAIRPLVLLVLVLTCLAFASGAWGQSAPLAGGPLRTHPMNPRYFSDGSGRAIYLTGSHFWTTIQSWNAAKVEASGPYAGGATFGTFMDYVNFLKARKHNFIRLWCFDSFQYESTPSPWVRTGPGTAFDGRPKWDVTKVNQAYLDRLRDRVRQFRENGIYVSVMFFRGNYALGTHPAWDAHPFKPTNNVNAELAGLTYDAYNGLSHARSLELQKQYIRSVIDTLNDMDNVFWEIANEGQPAGYLWQQHLADYVRDYESKKPRQHVVGITSTHPKDNTRLSNTTADWIAPGGAADFDQNNPPATAGTRPVFSDTDHHLLSAATVPFAWKSLVRGYHPILMENELAWDLEAVRLAMGHTRTQADRMNLAAMTPQNVLSETTYCLANPGVEYLVYAPNGGTFWVDLSAASGKTLAGEWINPRTGAVVARSGVLGGQTRQSFSAPVNDFGAVVYLKSTGPIRWPPRRNIAGPSVFPTGGYANPVLATLALTLRLADHVKELVKGSVS